MAEEQNLANKKSNDTSPSSTHSDINILETGPFSHSPGHSDINILETPCLAFEDGGADLEIATNPGHILGEQDRQLPNVNARNQAPTSPTGDFEPGYELERDTLSKTFKYLRTIQEGIPAAHKRYYIFDQCDFSRDMYQIEEEELCCPNVEEEIKHPESPKSKENLKVKEQQHDAHASVYQWMTSLSVDNPETRHPHLNPTDFCIMHCMQSSSDMATMEGNLSTIQSEKLDEKKHFTQQPETECVYNLTRKYILGSWIEFKDPDPKLLPENPRDAFMQFMHGKKSSFSPEENEKTLSSGEMIGSRPLICLGEELLPKLDNECQEALGSARELSTEGCSFELKPDITLEPTESILASSSENEEFDVEETPFDLAFAPLTQGLAACSHKEASTQVNETVELPQDLPSISTHMLSNQEGNSPKKRKPKPKSSRRKLRKFLCFTIP